MQSTRARIIELLRGGGGTVDDITHRLELAPATVRRHLDVLLRDGLVEMRTERLRLGRPHFVFSLTSSGMESVPGHQMHLVSTVIDAILALTPSDTVGRSGREVAALIFDRLAQRIVAQCRPRITAMDASGRAKQAVAVLASAGLDFDLALTDEGYVLSGTGCPCGRLLTGSSECPHEAAVLSSVLGTDVERLKAADTLKLHSYLVRLGA